MIGGFIVQGTEPATVILRGIGPSLAAVPISGLLDDPMITVYDASQQRGREQRRLVHQRGRRDDRELPSRPAEQPRICRLSHPRNPAPTPRWCESFTNAQQPPTPGVGLFELYDLSTTGGRAGNISTRAQVLGGTNVLIGGTIIGGTDPKTVVVRAIGPSLGAAGISNPLSDPTLELRDVQRRSPAIEQRLAARCRRAGHHRPEPGADKRQGVRAARDPRSRRLHRHHAGRRRRDRRWAGGSVRHAARSP